MPSLTPGVTSATLAGFPQIAYQAASILEWQANTPFLKELTDSRPLPRRVGLTQQFYGQVPFVAAAGPVAETVPPPSLSLQQVLAQNTADPYGDWIGVDSTAQATFLADITLEASRNLSYRGALTANQVVVNAFEAAAAAMSSARIDLADNQFLLSNTIKLAESQLMQNNVPTRMGGMYTAVMSPLVAYDFTSDNSMGGWSDTAKRNTPSALIKDMTVGYGVYEWAGVRIIRTTTVSSYANYPSSGKVGYATTIVGKEAMISSELIGEAVPKDPAFKTKIKILGDNDTSLADPLLQTRAIVSYWWWLGVCSRPNTNNTAGFRRIRSESSAV